MSTPAQVGKNVYRDELAKGREASAEIRTALAQLIEEPGPQTRALLIAKAAVALTRVESAFSQLDEIGRQQAHQAHIEKRIEPASVVQWQDTRIPGEEWWFESTRPLLLNTAAQSRRPGCSG